MTWLDPHKRLCDYDIPKTDSGTDIMLYYAIRYELLRDNAYNSLQILSLLLGIT